MHRVLMVVTALSLAGAMEAKAAGASTKPPLSGWATAAGVGSKTGSAFDRVNEIANEALQLTTSSEPAPAPTPERIQAAGGVAKLLPPIGSGDGAEKVTQYEVNIDPPAGAPYVARATISFAGDRPVTLYVLKKPIVQRGAPDQDGANTAGQIITDIVGLSTGETARTSTAGGNPTIACIAKPIAKDRNATCSVSLPGIPILLTGTYSRRNDSDPAFDRATHSRLVAIYNRLRLPTP